MTNMYYGFVLKPTIMNPISIRISENNQTFIEQMSKFGMNKTDIVNRALDLLRKARLQKDLMAMAMDDPKGDAIMAEEGMDDYLNLIKDEF